MQSTGISVSKMEPAETVSVFLIFSTLDASSLGTRKMFCGALVLPCAHRRMRQSLAHRQWTSCPPRCRHSTARAPSSPAQPGLSRQARRQPAVYTVQCARVCVCVRACMFLLARASHRQSYQTDLPGCLREKEEQADCDNASDPPAPHQSLQKIK